MYHSRNIILFLSLLSTLVAILLEIKKQKEYSRIFCSTALHKLLDWLKMTQSVLLGSFHLSLCFYILLSSMSLAYINTTVYYIWSTLPVIPDHVQYSLYYQFMEHLYNPSNQLILFVAVAFYIICLALKAIFGCLISDSKDSDIKFYKVWISEYNIDLYWLMSQNHQQSSIAPAPHSQSYRGIKANINMEKKLIGPRTFPLNSGYKV